MLRSVRQHENEMLEAEAGRTQPLPSVGALRLAGELHATIEPFREALGE